MQLNRLSVFAVSSLVAIVGCTNGVGPDRLAELESARQQWGARGFQDYTFETSTSCFCIAELNQQVRVEVRNDQVVSVTLVATGDPVQSPLTVWFTIDELFDRIERMVDAQDGGFTLELEYHADLGYPILVNSIAPPNLADGGSLVRVFTMAALP